MYQKCRGGGGGHCAKRDRVCFSPLLRSSNSLYKVLFLPMMFAKKIAFYLPDGELLHQSHPLKREII